MKYRPWIIDIFVVVIISSIFILCYNYIEKGTVSSSSNLDRRYKIYLITTDNKDVYWTYLNQGAADMAALLGVTYTWNAPDTKNTQKQIEILNDAVNSGANAVLIAANDPVKISGAIEDAKARGVKVLYVDTPAYEEAITTLSTDNYDAGREAGETMIAQLVEQGIRTGKIGIVTVNKATDSTVKREEGFRNVIDEDGRFIILPSVYENGDPIASEAAAADFIAAHKDFVGLFGTNEGSSVGVGNAIKQDNNRIVGIGFDQSATTLQLLKDGSLKAILVQNPYTMGYLGIAQAVAALKGLDTGPRFLDTGVSVLVKR